MNKERIKTCKKLFCIIVALLFSINTFAAIISDNDGSAFVTKSEFESLKENFANQVDQYNTSIDTKLDGAIAAYLAGLKLETKEDISCLLDNKGKYGNKYALYWSSHTNKRSINDTYAYATYTLNYSEYDYDNDNFNCWGGLYRWTNVFNGVENNTYEKRPRANLYRVYEGSTLKETQIFYENVQNFVSFQLFFQFPTWIPGGVIDGGEPTGYQLQNLLDLNSSDLKQGSLKNKVVTYFRKFNGGYDQIWSVWKQCYVTLSQDETNIDNIILYPFSNAFEEIWDKEDNTLDLSWEGTTSRLPAKYPYGTPYPAPGYKSINRTDNWKVGIVVRQYYYLPWQLIQDSQALKSRKIKNLIDINDKNSTAEYGVVLGTIPEVNSEMSLTIDVSVTGAGKVYAYVGDNAIKNWKETSFKGKSISISDTSKPGTLKIENVEKKQTIWLFYEPTNTSNNYQVKVNSIYVEY